MASIFFGDDPLTYVDYSLADKRVRSLVVGGMVWYDENEGVSVDGWTEELVKFVKEQGLDVDHGDGLPAFVYGLIERRLLGP